MTRLPTLTHTEVVPRTAATLPNEHHATARISMAGPFGLNHVESPLVQIEILTAEEANQLCKYSSFCAIEAMQSHPNLQAFALASRGLWGLVSIAQTSKSLSKQQLLTLVQRCLVPCNSGQKSATKNNPAAERSALPAHPLSAKLSVTLPSPLTASAPQTVPIPLSVKIKVTPLTSNPQACEPSIIEEQPKKAVAMPPCTEAEAKPTQRSPIDEIPSKRETLSTTPAASSDEDVAIDVDAGMAKVSRIQESASTTFQFLEKVTPPLLGLTGEALVSSGCLSAAVCSSQLASHLAAGGLTLLALNGFLRAGLALKTASDLTQSLARFQHSQATPTVQGSIARQLTDSRALKYYSAATASGAGMALIVTIIAPPVGCAIFTPFLAGNLIVNQLERQAQTPITPPDKIAHCDAPEILLSMAFDHLTRQIEVMSDSYLKRFATAPEAVLHSISQQFQNHIYYLQRVLAETGEQPAGLTIAQDAAHIGRPQQLHPEQTRSQEIVLLSTLVSTLMQPDNFTNKGRYKPNSPASLELLHVFWQGTIQKPGAQQYWEKRWRAWGITHLKLGANNTQLFDVKKLSILAQHPGNKKILSGLYAITFQYFADLKRKKQHTKNVIGGMLLRKSSPTLNISTNCYSDLSRKLEFRNQSVQR
jgi:hypothetical protein